jgi:hypothetical protein
VVSILQPDFAFFGESPQKVQVFVAFSGSHPIQSLRPVFTTPDAVGPDERSRDLTLTCPSCGNSQNFLVKTLQMHVVHLEDSRVEVSEESRPAVFEVLCDECETALNFEEFEDALRKEVLLTLGAR